MKTICLIFSSIFFVGVLCFCDIPNPRDPEVQKMYEMDSNPVEQAKSVPDPGKERKQIPEEVKRFGRQLREELSKMNAETEVELTMNFVDSTWDITFFKIEKGYLRTLFSYHILSIRLSEEKLNSHRRQQLMRSCMVDEYTSKKIKYKNFFLEPGCGNVNDKQEEKVVDDVYTAMKKLGAKETDKYFMPVKN